MRETTSRETIRAMRTALICLALAACMPPSEPLHPMPDRTETVQTETAIERVMVAAKPVGATSWKIAVKNESNAPVSILWDESAFVTADGESGGRLIRGETRRIDMAKAQPPTPVPANSQTFEIVLIEKLAESEFTEGDYARHNAKYGGVSPRMNVLIDESRAFQAKLIAGGALNIAIQLADGKKTWVGRVSGGTARPATPAKVKSETTGFFCSSSPANPTAGFCTRAKAECQRTRDAAIVGVADLAECALTEKAWCLGERCFTTFDACTARVGTDGVCGEVE